MTAPHDDCWTDTELRALLTHLWRLVHDCVEPDDSAAARIEAAVTQRRARSPAP